MSRIKILSESLANQIAAGEVVERPASVVKELVENALDAGAKHISVQVEGGGTRLIRVVDDGSGMDQDDVLLSLERHATSKLTSLEQLSLINTLGFRGEAIPSIASVSRMSITSRAVGGELGCRVDVQFGSIKKVHEMGCAQGTVLEVRNLFGNVPARRKFLKTAKTEVAHIDEVVRAYGLARNGVGFSFQVDGRGVIELSADCDSPAQRAARILGFSGSFIELVEESKTDCPGAVGVSGYLVPPDQAIGRAGRLWLFVNGRTVKDRTVSHAISEGLQGFLMKGRRPAGVIFLRVPADSIDVNVHPSKQEIRFRQAGEVHKAVVAAVICGMDAFQHHLKSELFGLSVAPDNAPVMVAERTISGQNRHNSPPVSPSGREDRYKPLLSTSAKLKDASSIPFVAGRVAEEAQIYEGQKQYRQEISAPVLPEVPPVPPSVADHSLENPSSIRYLGQLLGTYLLCEMDEGLVAIDQHAAQERLIYEELRQHYQSQDMPSQILMFPEMFEVAAADIQLLEQFGGEITRLGFDVKEFGGETFVINAVPASLAHLPATEIMQGILDNFATVGDGVAIAARLDAVLAGMACKAAIKAGHNLDEQEAESLLVQMQSAGAFSHCPHGRPVVKRFSCQDIQKWFHRT